MTYRAIGLASQRPVGTQEPADRPHNHTKLSWNCSSRCLVCAGQQDCRWPRRAPDARSGLGPSGNQGTSRHLFVPDIAFPRSVHG